MIISYALPLCNRHLLTVALNRLAENPQFPKDVRRQAEHLALFLAPARELYVELDDPGENGE
jgi:hypothetical protein